MLLRPGRALAIALAVRAGARGDLAAAAAAGANVSACGWPGWRGRRQVERCAWVFLARDRLRQVNRTEGRRRGRWRGHEIKPIVGSAWAAAV